MTYIWQCIPIPQAHLFHAECRKHKHTYTHIHKVVHNKLALMHMQMHCLICIFFETKLQTTLLYFCLFAQNVKKMCCNFCEALT